MAVVEELLRTEENGAISFGNYKLDAKMGARPLKRAIQSEIEDALAEEILLGNVKRGDKVAAGFKNKKIVFTVRDDI